MALQLRILRPQGDERLGVRETTERRVTMTAFEVDEALRSGALRTTDLVELDGSWHFLADAIPFVDAAAVALARERRLAFLVAARQALLASVVVAGSTALYFALLEWVRRTR